jgi:hypothetical protein
LRADTRSGPAQPRPARWRHPSKALPKSWYGRAGYRAVGSRSVVDAHPHLAPLLATPCDVVVHQNALQVPSAPAQAG